MRGWECERAMSISSACSGAPHGRSQDASGPIGAVRSPITAAWSSFTLGCVALMPGINTC